MGVPQINESRFASSDGRTYRLRVETFGGGSARTIFSLLTGVSVQSFFGGMKNIATNLAPGNMHYSLPLQMRSCGYRTIAITTGSNGYVPSGHFYQSIGFQDYFDLNDILRRTTGDSSDRAIYGFLSEIMASKNDGSPIFAYVDTVASHAPYSYAVRPEETVPEAELIGDPIISEYVRRLIIGERDLEKFIQQSRESAVRGGRPLVVLDFGDHQPYFTRDLPGHSGHVIEDREHDDPHMLTYFRIQSTGRALAELPADHAIVDVAFLSDWLVHALDLQIEGIYKIRWPLVERCKSRYWQCERNSAAHELHQILKSAGIVSYP
jgi:phosphoglycerol transferase MdoB-like AlkP superfamily enzyme